MQNLKIEKIESVTDKINLFTLGGEAGVILEGYKPGAHIDIDLGELGLRSYSLIDFVASEDNPSSYLLAVQKEEDGQGGSRAMHAFSVGDVIKTSSPKNDFQLHEGDAPSLLIAGGIGVTPIISFATALSARGADYSFHYAVRNKDVMPFADQLEAAFAENLTVWFDDQKMIDLEDLMQKAAPETHIYCCGPRGMIEAVRAKAEAAGFANEQIHFELFASPTTQEGEKSFEVEIADGRVFTIPADKSIVEVLEENDVDVMYDCSRGDCGICQTDVVSGIPDHRDVVLSEAERESGKIMQICVSRAKSDRLVLDIE